ncbi:acetate--CoA ligase family protein [Dactylosporangium sp. NBC_01737]|uniref:acetate--CoA ligase family protein n=1 Tax=Dactylosporangium sp. NBC_01737 TaxID=2975959 RepID=UPI002E1112AF|nr:acetate--CoA ligase family protein [Dactylosporangium sp. NBC_01737]
MTVQSTPRPGVALVGARDGSLWTYLLFHNLRTFGDAEIWPVSRTRPEVRGVPTVADLSLVPRTPDVAVLIVNSAVANSVVAQAVEMKVPHIVLISDGYAERGTEEGIRLQRELVGIVEGSGSRLYGPNGVGFADFRAGIAPLGAPIPADLRVGGVSVVSQSGSLTSTIMGGLAEDGAGVDLCVSIGNGAAFDPVDAMETMLDRPSTTVIAAYLESFGGDRARLERTLTRARAQGVTIVLAKSGGSAIGAAIARSHTAALAGPDRLVEEVLTAHGVIRVRSMEELTRAAAIADYLSRRPAAGGKADGASGGVAVIETSGGAAALTADLLTHEGVGLATFGDTATSALRAVAPDGAYVSNPIDLTASPKPYEEVTAAFHAVYTDPAVRAVVIPYALTFPTADDERDVHRRSLDRYADLGAASGCPTIVSTLSDFAWTDWAVAFRERHPETLLVRGIATTARMLARLYPRTEPEAAGAPQAVGAADVLGDAPDGRTARDLLDALDVPMPKAAFVAAEDIDGVAGAVTGLAYPHVVKIVADGLLHKVKVGGVVLGCATAEQTEAAARRVLASAAAAGLPGVRGVLVEETGTGVELFVSLNRDPWYGPYLIVGSGGGDVEAKTDSSLIALPAADGAVERALDRLPVPDGQRAATAALIARLAAEFVGGRLAAWSMLELNPVMVDAAAGPQILDIVLLPVAGPA